MLKVYVRGRKRRVWSPGTVAASVGAHLLLLAGAVSAAGGDGHEHKDDGIDENVAYIEIEKPKVTPPPPAVEPQAPPPPKPDAPTPKLGDHRVIENVPAVPTEIPVVTDPNEKFDPTQYSGEGRQDGNVIVDNPPPSSEPTEAGTPEPAGDGPVTLDMVEERPELSNRSLAERLLRQNYPDLLRDAGVTGRTIVTMVIDAEGKVEPGSVRVIESSHEAFSEPAVKVAERMRFRPAKLNRQAVPVLITLPIEWKIER